MHDAGRVAPLLGPGLFVGYKGLDGRIQGACTSDTAVRMVGDLTARRGRGAKNHLDTLARVATALDRHLIVSFPEKVPARLKDAVQVA